MLIRMPVIDPFDPDFTSTPAAEERARFDYAPASSASEPIVTIATPFRDTAPDIFAETTRSVERQSLQQWEWLIVDDGSTRNDSREALMQLERQDGRVRVIRHEHSRGVSAARNAAIEAARAPFVLLLDSDDVIEPTTAEKWLWFLISHEEYAFVDGYVVAFGEQELLWPKGFSEGRRFLGENFVGARALVRRDVLRKVGGFDATMRDGLEDWDLWLKCAAHGYWGATVPEYLAWHRTSRHESHQERWPAWDRGHRQKAVRRELRRRYPHLWRGRFPRIKSIDAQGADIDLEGLPAENTLAKTRPRLLLMLPWTAVGGADKFNLDLIAQLSRRGWEMTVVTTLHGDHSWLPRFTRLTPDVFALAHLLKPEDYPRFMRYMVRSRQPDAVLITHSLFAYEALPYLRVIADGIPIVDYCHVVEDRWLDGGYPRKSVEKHDFLDLNIASSVALSEWMIREGADPERVEVCYTNIAPRKTLDGPSRRRLGLPEDVPLIVYPGRMAEQKQPPVFAKTMLELRRRGYRYLALAIGGGPYLGWLKFFVRRNRLQKQVRCLGVQPNARVQDLIAVADCVFIPSTHEGISLAFYEAMASGVPVVGADVGGQRELVVPECGVLIERGDEATEVRRYADALGGLLDDPERRQAMGDAGQARIAAHFALDQMGDRMVALLERAAELASASPRRVPSVDEARRAALDGVRIVWWTTPAPRRWIGAMSGRVGDIARHTLFRALRTIGMPFYNLGMRLGLHWLEPLKDRVYHALFHQPK